MFSCGRDIDKDAGGIISVKRKQTLLRSRPRFASKFGKVKARPYCKANENNDRSIRENGSEPRRQLRLRADISLLLRQLIREVQDRHGQGLGLSAWFTESLPLSSW